MKLDFQFDRVEDNNYIITKVDEKFVYIKDDVLSAQYSHDEWIGTAPKAGMQVVTAVDVYTSKPKLVQKHS